jgi:uncharacterized SAM-binding protein YcdF (DUF218 family)
MRGAWLPLVGGVLIVADPATASDVIVPLAGERSRVDYGARLFEQGIAKWFVVTDMWIDAVTPPLTYANSVTEQAVGQGVPRDRILVVPGMPRTTYEEAIVLRRFAHERGLRSLLVVTSPFHTRRSRMIFRDVFAGSGVDVAIRPVEGHWYTAESWWTTDEGWKVTALEYIKLALYEAGYH